MFDGYAATVDLPGIYDVTTIDVPTSNDNIEVQAGFQPAGNSRLLTEVSIHQGTVIINVVIDASTGDMTVTFHSTSSTQTPQYLLTTTVWRLRH